MPIDPVTGSLIVAGVSAAGQAVNAISQGSINKKTRKYNEKMYEKQKSDNLNLWNQQNSYNHPSAQMARLREAGLNPNMVYGTGTDVTAPSIQNSTPASWNPRAPEIDAGSVATSGFSTYFDAQTKQAQANNLIAQNDLIKQEALLRSVQTAAASQNLDRDSQLYPISLEAAKLGLRKTSQDIDIAYNQNERDAMRITSDLTESFERVLTMRAQRSTVPLEQMRLQEAIKGMSKDNTLKQIEINLREKGINPNDPIWLRMIGQAVSNIAKGMTLNQALSIMDKEKYMEK